MKTCFFLDDMSTQVCSCSQNFFQIFCVPLVREHELCETSVPCYLRHLPVASGSLPAVNLWGAQTSSGSTPLSRRYPKSTWPLSNTTNSARKTSVGLKPFTLIASILLTCCTNCCGESIFYRRGANRQGNNTNHGFNAFNSNARKSYKTSCTAAEQRPNPRRKRIKSSKSWRTRLSEQTELTLQTWRCLSALGIRRATPNFNGCGRKTVARQR